MINLLESDLRIVCLKDGATSRTKRCARVGGCCVGFELMMPAMADMKRLRARRIEEEIGEDFVE